MAVLLEEMQQQVEGEDWELEELFILPPRLHLLWLIPLFKIILLKGELEALDKLTQMQEKQVLVVELVFQSPLRILILFHWEGGTIPAKMVQVLTLLLEKGERREVGMEELVALQ
jgi:hypothetical protein